MSHRHLALLVLAAAAACTPVHGTAYQVHYDVVPRKVLLNALDAARELHYSVVAVESPDVYHNNLLAFAEGTPARAPAALLIQIITDDPLCPPTQAVAQPGVVPGCVAQTPGTKVAVTPLAFRDGRELPAAQVPAQTRHEAEQLMFAIYDRSRSYLAPRRFY